MYTKSERLIRDLTQRFGYTQDNNRDIISDPTFTLAEAMDEIAVQAAYQTIIAHLTHCDEASDRACWGTAEPDDQAHHNH
jgi:hypothetical protein